MDKEKKREYDKKRMSDKHRQQFTKLQRKKRYYGDDIEGYKSFEENLNNKFREENGFDYIKPNTDLYRPRKSRELVERDKKIKKRKKDLLKWLRKKEKEEEDEEEDQAATGLLKLQNRFGMMNNDDDDDDDDDDYDENELEHNNVRSLSNNDMVTTIEQHLADGLNSGKITQEQIDFIERMGNFITPTSYKGRNVDPPKVVDDYKIYLDHDDDETIEEGLLIEMAINGSKFLDKLLEDSSISSNAINKALVLAYINNQKGSVHLLLDDSRVDPSTDNNFVLGDMLLKGHVYLAFKLLKDKRVVDNIGMVTDKIIEMKNDDWKLLLSLLDRDTLEIFREKLINLTKNKLKILKDEMSKRMRNIKGIKRFGRRFSLRKDICRRCSMN